MTNRQRRFVNWIIGQEVQIDSSGNRGTVTSVSVTSDGFILGRTTPGHDRGVFLGSVPPDESLADWEAEHGNAVNKTDVASNTTDADKRTED